jgi:hypothetical protein
MAHKSVPSPWENKQPQPQPFPSMVMPMGMMDGAQMMNPSGLPFQMSGFPTMPSKGGMPQAVYMPSMIQVPVGDKKPQSGSTTSDKDKNPREGATNGLGMPTNVSSEMIMKMFGGQIPNMPLGGLPPGAMISMMPPGQAGLSGQHGQLGQHSLSKSQNKPS